MFGKPLQLWWKDLFESAKPRFNPIQFLVRQCVSMNISYEDQTLLLLCPVKNLLGLTDHLTH